MTVGLQETRRGHGCAKQTQRMRSSLRPCTPPMLSLARLGTARPQAPSTRRRSALLTAAVSVGTDHRPSCCLLAAAPLGLIAVRHDREPRSESCDFSTEDSDLSRWRRRERGPAHDQWRKADRRRGVVRASVRACICVSDICKPKTNTYNHVDSNLFFPYPTKAREGEWKMLTFKKVIFVIHFTATHSCN